MIGAEPLTVIGDIVIDLTAGMAFCIATTLIATP